MGFPVYAINALNAPESSGGGGDVHSIFIHAEEHTTKETYVVPVLTDDQIISAYNGIVAGHNVFIVDDLDFITIQVLDATNITEEVSIAALFRDKLILIYQVGEEVVATPISAAIQKALTISDNPSDDKFPTEKAIYDYIASGNDGYPRELNSVDLNTVTNTGFYSCNVCTNRPVQANGILIVGKMVNTATYIMQTYYAFAEDKVYVRFNDNGAWKTWKRISGEPAAASVTYDPTASGLDADNVQDAIDELAGRDAPVKETYTLATTDWTALTGASPFTVSATVTAEHTIGTDTVCELINDQAVLFANCGFAIGAVSGQSVTIYAISAPTASVTLEVDYHG